MRELALVLPLYGGAVVWLTWPLAAHLRTHLPDTQMICALLHQSHTLITAPWRLAEANIYHPAHHAFFYSDAGFGALPYFMPTFLLTANPQLASNLTLLTSLAPCTSRCGAGRPRTWPGWWPPGPSSQPAGSSGRGRPRPSTTSSSSTFPSSYTSPPRPWRGRRRTLLLLLLLVLQGLVTIYVALPMLVGLGLVGVARMVRRAGCAVLEVAGVSWTHLFVPLSWGNRSTGNLVAAEGTSRLLRPS